MTPTPIEPFVPLTSARPDRTHGSDFRVLTSSHPTAQTSASRGAEAKGPFTPETPQPREPRVVLQRDGDKIIGITIHCSCGQIIDLTCAYPQQGTALHDNLTNDTRPNG